MQDIYQYILLSKKERQAHLRLEEPCLTQGKVTSLELRPLLAFVLNTTMPEGITIHCCHACNNSKCRNPYHLYWGTPKENRADSIECGRSPASIWQKTVDKHGIEAASVLWKSKARFGFYKTEKGIEVLKNRELRKQAALKDARRDPKRNSQYGTRWLTKAESEMQVKQDQIADFLREGWTFGRINKPPLPTRV